MTGIIKKGLRFMKIYDKAQWHIDAGENSHEVIEKFRKYFLSLRLTIC